MVHISLIEARLSHLGVKLSRWFRAEVRELQHVLFDGEEIIAAVPGRYFAGYALLVATDHRVLLIDKRALFMNIEDIRYDMIAETDFNSQLSGATLQIFTLNKQHRFSSMKYKRQLRDLCNYIQQRIMEMRGYQSSPNQQNLMPYNPAERFPSAPQPIHIPAQQLRPALPTTQQSQNVGAAALNAFHRPRLISGGFSARSNVPVGDSLR
jgi:Bacterial PH domain